MHYFYLWHHMWQLSSCFPKLLEIPRQLIEENYIPHSPFCYSWKCGQMTGGVVVVDE